MSQLCSMELTVSLASVAAGLHQVLALAYHLLERGQCTDFIIRITIYQCTKYKIALAHNSYQILI